MLRHMRIWIILSVFFLTTAAVPGAASGGFTSADPAFGVNPGDGHVFGHSWLSGSPVDVFVNEEFLLTATPDPFGNWFEYVDPALLAAGDEVQVTDGTTTKTHIVTTLEITWVVAGLSLVSGRADPGTDVNVWVEEGEPWRHTVTTPEGTWEADFSVPGDEPGEEGTVEFTAGMGGGSAQCDDDGDCTHALWNVPEPLNPAFRVFWDANLITGEQWTFGAPVTVTIDDDDDPTTVLHTYEVFADEEGFFVVGGDEGFDVMAGHYVVVTDGTSTKDHWVTTVMFTGADPDLDIVTGTAEPGSLVLVQPEIPNPVWEHLTLQYGPENRNPDSLNEHLAFRQALAHAIDRDAIVDAVSNGRAHRLLRRCVPTRPVPASLGTVSV